MRLLTWAGRFLVAKAKMVNRTEVAALVRNGMALNIASYRRTATSKKVAVLVTDKSASAKARDGLGERGTPLRSLGMMTELLGVRKGALAGPVRAAGDADRPAPFVPRSDHVFRTLATKAWNL
mmetsp:Transcript_7731/g.22857  ORF Transcript_7731/g.22857 Transcript_7731/m.22857 type:complete len:123 (-) Transcript_7731:1320-1688(-)